MKLYGSYQNRLMENATEPIIEVGMGVTEYLYSDRHPYEVTKVIDQKHIEIRGLDHVADGEPMSNEWKLVSNENNPVISLCKRGNTWYTKTVCTREDIEQHKDDIHFGLWLAMNFDYDRIMAKGKQTKYNKMNIRVGSADYYFDYEF